ncbi:hypothetical protein B0H16DRAFT_829757 [Mycena metata]|uniref:Uncharacterized protein n=1 Tax=Mycena metata TaxID=1033252 RepID=A0AAD7N9V8_9AGAR|nr:hypothetical protein B0H16DRAFT_829757 [Mycena metata]
MVLKYHPSNGEVDLPVNCAFLPVLDIEDGLRTRRHVIGGWCGPGEPEGAPSDVWLDSELMPDSWRRYTLHQIFAAASIQRIFGRHHLHLKLWLAQANYIFSSLQIKSHHDQYVVVDEVIFSLSFSPTTRSSCPSEGWLFVCPDDQLRSGPGLLRWPDCAAYWSRDPFGSVRLSAEEAEEAPPHPLRFDGVRGFLGY